MRLESCFGVFAIGCAFALCARAATLPAEYIRLEYIQGTGTQWINTGYKPNSTDTIEEEVEFSGVGQNQAFWCARTDGAKATFTFFFSGSRAGFASTTTLRSTPSPLARSRRPSGRATR